MSPRFPVSVRLLSVLLCAPPLGCASHDDDPATTTPAATGSMAGLAADTAGKPLAGVEVSTSPTTGFAVTDAAGSWKLSSISAGTYTVTAARSGYRTVEKTGVVIAAGGSAIVDFTMAPLAEMGDLVGKITDAKTAAPIALAKVSTDAATLQVETGPDGAYKITGIAIGTYKVKAEAKGYAAATSAPVTVTNGAATTVDLKLEPVPTFDSSCTSCHTRVDQLLADLTADPLPVTGGEGGSAGEG